MIIKERVKKRLNRLEEGSVNDSILEFLNNDGSGPLPGGLRSPDEALPARSYVLPRIWSRR
jgi:hypothetical protein